MSFMRLGLSVFSAIILAIGISGCGYDGHYRYPCQDPVNWEAPECNPPICEATGTCTVDLLGYDPKEGKEEILDELLDETTSDIIDESTEWVNPASETKPDNVDQINGMVDQISEGN